MHLGQFSSLVGNSLWQSEPDGREKIDVTKLMQRGLGGKMEVGGLKAKRIS